MTSARAVPNPGSGTEHADYDVVVVGGGFSGIYQLRRLRELGYSVVLLEAGPALGGVWSINRYPGARVDSAGPIYQFSDEQLWKDWEFSELYPDHREMRAYFAHVDAKLDLSKDCRFGAKVIGADFDESSVRWTLQVGDGSSVSARFVVFATGSTVEPYVPAFPGVADFRGTLVHTARWPEGLDLTGKRVAVVGTGASGIQVIQEIGPTADRLTVFQRTPNLALPMGQRTLSPEDNDELKETYSEVFARRATTFAGIDFDFDPRKAVEASDEEREAMYEELWQQGGFRFWLATFADTMFDPAANGPAYEFWKRKTRELVADPAKAAVLAPDEPPHPFGTKRPSLYQSYYEVLDRDDVEIVSVRQTPIESFTARGIRTADGREHEFDAIVLATGYDNNTGALTAIDVRGTDGRTLREKWADGVDNYLGTLTAGFPNLLFLYGPQSPAAFANGPTSAELQGEAIVELLEHMRRNGLQRVESTEAADRAWTAEIAAIDEIALFRLADSWYNAANIPGKHRQMLQYPGGIPAYLERWQTVRDSGYSTGIQFS